MRLACLLPPALFLIILPFPGTVAARLLLLAISFVIAAWLWWREPERRAAIPGRPVLAVWAIVCLLSGLYAVDTTYTLGELKNEVLYTMMAFFAFFTFAKDTTHAQVLIRAMAVGLVIIGTWALTNWIAGGFVWDEHGRHGGIGVFATYLVTVFPAVGFLALSDTSTGLRRLAVALLVMIVVLAIATAQRAVWPALAAEFLLFAFLIMRNRNPNIRLRYGVIALITILTIASVGLLISQARRFGNSTATATGISTDSRLQFWPGLVTTIAEHPLTGVGFGQRSVAKAYPQLVPDYNPLLWHAHNVVLNYGIGMGIPGMLALLALFGWWGWFFSRAAARGPSAVAGLAGLALVGGVLTRNQFNDFFTRDMSLMFWALVGIFAGISARAAPADGRLAA